MSWWKSQSVHPLVEDFAIWRADNETVVDQKNIPRANSVGLNLLEHCPFLKTSSELGTPPENFALKMDLRTESGKDIYCEIGKQRPRLDAIQTKPNRVKVDLSCAGCEFLEGGFSKMVARRKI